MKSVNFTSVAHTLILSFRHFVVLWTIIIVGIVQLEEGKMLPVTPEVNEESTSLMAATGRSDTPEPDLRGPTPPGNYSATVST